MKPKKSQNTIKLNKKATFNWFLEKDYEAGIKLEGWEVKAIRSKNISFEESYVKIKNGEVFLIGSHITPLSSTSSHIKAIPNRDRKLLLNKREINQLVGSIKEDGYSIIPVEMYWKEGKVKLRISLAKGKKNYDKRQSLKEKDMKRNELRNTKY